MKVRIPVYVWLILSLIVASAGWFFWPEPVKLRVTELGALPGWKQADFQASLDAFKHSCRVFLRQAPKKQVGSTYFVMTASDWQPICRQLMRLENPTRSQAMHFFQTHFIALEFNQNKPVTGLFTGYYMPLLHGSRQKTHRYRYPIYKLPSTRVFIDLADFGEDFPAKKITGLLKGKRVYPMPERAEINRGVLDKEGEVLLWVDNRVDRFYLEIQGSGVVEFEDGSKQYIGYAGANGASYTPIGKVMVEKGMLDKQHVSMQNIRRVLTQNPERMDEVLHRNKSFVFFQKAKRQAAFGAQGVALSPGYSLAVDRKWIPLGMPLWLDASHPDVEQRQHPLQRLMIAQDTGGAIKGMVRGDVYWGASAEAAAIAGMMQNAGHYWMLVPKFKVQDFLSAQLSK